MAADRPDSLSPSARASRNGHALAAAMLAVGEILEPDKTQVEITQLNDDDFDPDLEFELHFGHLDPLD